MLKYNSFIKEEYELTEFDKRLSKLLKASKFKKGDTVWYVAGFSMLSKYYGENEVINTYEDINDLIWYALRNKKSGKEIKWINREDLYSTEKEYKSKRKELNNNRIERDKEIKRKEEAKQKFIDDMKEFDPYGEEEWDDMLKEERKIPYKKTLCQDLWEDDKLIERIREKLIKIAKDFFNDVELETEIKDIYLTGSMANYNYTEESDIDVHIVCDFKDINEDTELVKKAIDGQRFIWNLRHNIIIKGHDVELYIQDETEEHNATGLYSLLNDEWITKPVYNPPNVDTKDVNVKYDARVYDILKYEKLSKQELSPEEAEEYYENAKELKSKIMKSRKEGLTEEGEFSIENLVFKKLRKEGKIKKIIDVITRFYDKIYSQ